MSSFYRFLLPPLACAGLALVAGCSDGDDGAPGADGRDGPAFTLNLLHASDQEAGEPAVEDAPRFSAVLEALAREYPDATLKVTSGDVWLPGLFYNAAGDSTMEPVLGDEGVGRADIALHNAMGWHAAAFGNHEFDNGPGVVESILAADGAWPGAQFPYLSCNLDFSASALDSLVVADAFQVRDASDADNKVTGSIVLWVDGEPIGIVGATTPNLAAISSPGDVGVAPDPATDYEALAAVIQSHVDQLTDQGIDKIILACHMQQFSIELDELAPRLDDVDIIIAGGNHSPWGDASDTPYGSDSFTLDYPQWRSSATAGEPIAVLNVGANYRYVGRFIAKFDVDGVLLRDLHDEQRSGAYACDTAGVTRLNAGSLVNARVQEVCDAIGNVITVKGGNVFGKTAVFLNGQRAWVRTEETNFGNLTADANLWAAQQTDATVALSLKNGGGIRDSIGTVGTGAVPTYDPPAGGDVSQLDIENTLRFNNDLTIFTITAAQLKELLEHGVAASGDGSTQGRFPQVGGLRFSWDPTRTGLAYSLAGTKSVPATYWSVTTAGERVRDIWILDGMGGETQILADGAWQSIDPNVTSYRMVTLGFIENGGDNYPFPRFQDEDGVTYNQVELDDNDSNDGFTDAGREQNALADYMAAEYPDTASAFDQADDSLVVGAPADTRIIQQMTNDG